MLNEIDLSRVDLNLLVLFEAVMDKRHVGRAAASLALSPSAVSHGLGRLRTLLGDPVFLRTPRGMNPTERAEQLAPLVADALARVRGILATAAPFDPRSSARRFTIGVPDGIAASLLPRLLRDLGRAAPGVSLSIRQLLPARGATDLGGAWAGALSELDAHTLDFAIIPTDAVPKRFARSVLVDEDFVIAMREGHPSAATLDLAEYCSLAHIVVSESGNPVGNVDLVLAEHGRSRRVALTVPNAMLALALVADTDLVCAMARRLVLQHGRRHGVRAVEPPLSLPGYRITAVAPEVALQDGGMAWLMGRLQLAATAKSSGRARA
jgi:DNA-binding transcriptional LysR family regulator